MTIKIVYGCPVRIYQTNLAVLLFMKSIKNGVDFTLTMPNVFQMRDLCEAGKHEEHLLLLLL